MRRLIGFDRYQNGLLPGSQARMLVDERSSSACEKVRKLEDQALEKLEQRHLDGYHHDTSSFDL